MQYYHETHQDEIDADNGTYEAWAESSNKCPACNVTMLHPDKARNSISRRNNKAVICAECGIIEALEDFAGHLREEEA